MNEPDALEQLRAERDKLQAFKTWVHAYLDNVGVPHHPPGPHGAEGCRVGDRMDWLMARVRDAEVVNAALLAAAKTALLCIRVAAVQDTSWREVLADLERAVATAAGVARGR